MCVCVYVCVTGCFRVLVSAPVSLLRVLLLWFSGFGLCFGNKGDCSEQPIIFFAFAALRTRACMYVCMYACMYVCMYGPMDGWMDGWYVCMQND